MGRPNRNFSTDNRYHVINHGVDNQDLFSIEDDWTLFESLIGRVCGDYSFQLNAYALMSNHFHFLVDLSDCDDRSGVSEAIGVLQSTYAHYFNDRTSRRGPLFEPRFLSFGVCGDSKTHRVIRYIHRNPIDICGHRAIGAYRWSSLPVYLGQRRSPSWLQCDLFKPQDPVAHVAELAGCEVDDFVPLDALAPQRRTTLEAIERAFAMVRREGMSDREREEIVFFLAFKLRAADVAEVAGRYGCSESKARKGAHRARIRRCDDPSFARLLDRVVSNLTTIA